MRQLVVAALTLLLFPTAGRADTISLGGSDGSGFPWPFGAGTRMQQVFDSSLFTGTWHLTGITFYNRVEHSAEGYVEPAEYRFFLSTTGTSSMTLTTSYDANLGSTTTAVRDWTVSDYSLFFSDSLTLSFATPFFFDPRNGNLLLDIRKDRTEDAGDGPIYVDGARGVPGMSLAGNTLRPAQDFLHRNGGVLVSFSGTFTPLEVDPAPVPEPASLLLAGAGLAALGRRRLAKRSSL